MIDTIDVVVAWDNTPRGHGQYAETKAFAVVSPSGDPAVSAFERHWLKLLFNQVVGFQGNAGSSSCPPLAKDYILIALNIGWYMLSVEYVRNLIRGHQEKAAYHLERLKAKMEIKDSEVNGWVYDEDIALYWSHSDVLYLPLNSCDFINYYLRGVHAMGFVGGLKEIINTDRDKLEGLYFEHVSGCWKRQGLTRSAIPKGFASKGFLDRVFKM